MLYILDETTVVENMGMGPGGHLNQVCILKSQKVMANLRFMVAMLVFGGRWEYFTMVFEILTDENLGIDTKIKSVDGLIRKIFVIEWFHLISMLIRSITHSSMDTKNIWDPYCWKCRYRHKNELSGKFNTEDIRQLRKMLWLKKLASGSFLVLILHFLKKTLQYSTFLFSRFTFCNIMIIALTTECKLHYCRTNWNINFLLIKIPFNFVVGLNVKV